MKLKLYYLSLVVTLFVICLSCLSIPLLAQTDFSRNDGYDFRGEHYLSARGSDPDHFNIFIESNSDFRFFKLKIIKNRLTLGTRAYCHKYRVDMNNDGTWELDWTFSDVTVSFYYPNPINGISANYTVTIEIEYADYYGPTYPHKTMSQQVTILSTPRVYVNSENDTFVQLRDEDCTTKIPVLLVEGFDPTNDKFPELYYNLTWDLVNTDLYPNEYEVFILNFHDGGRDLRLNADVLFKALEKIHVICPNYKIAVAGLSMGGPITRYSLAKKESQGGTHNVGLFLSYDSPQDGAHVNPGMQDWIKDQNANQEAIRIMQDNLKSVAAKQMLRYNTYEPEHESRLAFYNEMNELNGDGYPHQSYNASVSNGNFNATWGYESVGRHLLTLKINDQMIHSENAVHLDCGSGSKMTDITMNRYGDIFYNPLIHLYYELQIIFNPAYIPTWSGLDLVNPNIDNLTGNITSFDRSKFDDYIVQATPLQHHELSTATRIKIMNWLNKNFNIGVNYNFIEGGSANPDNYQVKILHSIPITVQPKTITVNGQQLTYNFAAWEDGNTENPRTFYTSHDVSHTATMKAHLVSDNGTATAGNSQRKIIRHGSPDDLYAVYVANDRIWYTKYHNGNWTAEKLVSSLDNPTAKNPSIAVYWPYVHFVWEETIDNLKVVCYRRYDENSSAWSDKVLLSTIDGSFDATPVLSTMGYSGKAVVVWKQFDGHPALNGYGTNLNVRLDPLDPLTQANGIDFIEAKFPSISDANGQNAYSLAWVSTENSIGFLQFTLDTQGNPTIVTQASTISGTNTTCSNPSITKATDGRIFIAWDALNSTTRHIFARERNASGVWQTVSEFSHATHQMSSPTIGVDENANRINVVFNCGDHPAKISRPLSSATWDNLCSYCQGFNPNLNASGNPYLFWTTGTGVLYTISLANTFTAPQQPLLIIPPNQQQNVSKTPMVGWNCTIGAAKYQLQISTSPAENFEDGIIFNRLNISTTSYQVTGLGYSTTYYWRVIAMNDIGASDPSPIWSFTTIADPFPPPVLSGTRILDGTVSHPKLTWSAVIGAVSYVLYRYECAGTEDCDDGIDQSYEIVYQGTALTFTDHSYSVVVKGGNGTIRYIVKAKNSLNQTSGRSNKVAFYIYYDLVYKNGEREGEIPLTTKLETSYPNPFNPITTVRYQLAEPGYVSLTVYNQLGQEVELLTQGDQEAGYFERIWDAKNNPSGSYFIRLLITDENGKQLHLSTEKVIVMK
jgi:hypothetical protein